MLGVTERLVIASGPLAMWAGALFAIVLLGMTASPPVQRGRPLDSLLGWIMALALCLVWYAAAMMLTGGPLT